MALVYFIAYPSKHCAVVITVIEANGHACVFQYQVFRRMNTNWMGCHNTQHNDTQHNKMKNKRLSLTKIVVVSIDVKRSKMVSLV